MANREHIIRTDVYVVGLRIILVTNHGLPNKIWKYESIFSFPFHFPVLMSSLLTIALNDLLISHSYIVLHHQMLDISWKPSINGSVN
jgi:hypothetical protein